MDQLELLELELKLFQDNINRIKEYKKQNEFEKYKPSNSRVLGELKHRSVSLKQRLTLIQKVSTNDLF